MFSYYFPILIMCLFVNTNKLILYFIILVYKFILLTYEFFSYVISSEVLAYYIFILDWI
jgi:hypothetical protein